MCAPPSNCPGPAELDLNAFCAEVGKLVDQAEYWKKIEGGFLQAAAKTRLWADMCAYVRLDSKKMLDERMRKYQSNGKKRKI